MELGKGLLLPRRSQIRDAKILVVEKGEKGGGAFQSRIGGRRRPKEAYLAMESVLGGVRKGGRQVNDLLLVLESLAQNGGILDTKCVELTAV